MEIPANSQEHPKTEQDLVVIASGPEKDLQTYSLVLTAVGIDNDIDPVSGALIVAAGNVSTALRQIQVYQEENKNWPPVQDVTQNPPFAVPQVTLVLTSMLVLFFLHTGGWYPENLWFEAGAVDRNLFTKNGQWWRIVTALTLHADIVHLAGNCLIGGPLISFLSRSTGYGLCWFLVLASGTAGNLVNILVRREQHLAVGFSTAVFATIGILTGMAMCSGRKQTIRQYLVPLGAGLGLLLFLGSEGARTDIGAHLFGFICGLITGVIVKLAHLVEHAASIPAHLLLLILSMGMVVLSWGGAFAFYPGLRF